MVEFVRPSLECAALLHLSEWTVLHGKAAKATRVAVSLPLLSLPSLSFLPLTQLSPPPPLTRRDKCSMATPTPRFDHFSEPVALLMESLTSIPGLALLRQSGLPIAAARQEVTTWYDGASGAGVMAKLLFDELKAKEEQGEMKVGVGERKVYILLGDSDQNMVNLAKQKLERKGWKDVEVKVFDAEVRFLLRPPLFPSSS